MAMQGSPSGQTTAGGVQRRRYHFTGRVQGVGFRYTVQNIAQQYDVRGYVRNLPDGRVELVMEGPEGEMDPMLDAILRRMGDFIRRTDEERSPGTGEFTRFCIKH
jgi:acylphosphatase